MRRPHLNALLTGGLIAALLAGVGLSHWLNSQGTDRPSTGLILPNARPLPDFALQDQNGAEIQRQDLKGQWHLMFFGFTHCPDICPNTLALMRQLRQDLPEEIRAQVRFAMVSVDPERDTAPVLKEYLAYFDPSFLGITGDLAAVSRFAEKLGIAFFKQGSDTEDYNVDHSTALVLLNPDAAVKAYFSAPHDLQSLHAALLEVIGT